MKKPKKPPKRVYVVAEYRPGDGHWYETFTKLKDAKTYKRSSEEYQAGCLHDYGKNVAYTLATYERVDS